MQIYQLSTQLIILLLITILTSCFPGEIPKIVWVYVQEIDSLNQFQKLSLNNVRFHITQSKYELRVITNANYSSYLTNYEEYEKIMRKEYIDLSILKRAYLQLIVLQTYGGIWIEIPVILTQSLQWLPTIKNQKYINHRIDSPQAILFYTPEWFQQTFKRVSGKVEDLVIYPKYHSWFVAGKQNSTLIHDWKKIFIETMMMNEKVFDNFIKLYGLDSKEYFIDHQYYPEWTLQTAIKIKQNELDKHYGTVASARRLAISQYKISGINTDQTAYLVNQQARQHTHLITKYFTQIPVQKLPVKATYLLKTSQKVTDEMTSIIDQQMPLSEHLHSSVSLVCQGAKIPFRHVTQGSIVDEYLIKISQKSTAKKYPPQFIEHNCSVTYQTVFYDFLLHYAAPLGAAVGQIYIVRRMLLIFKPEWGVRRRM